MKLAGALMLTLALLSVSSSCLILNSKPYPVVLMHGVNSDALSMDYLAGLIEQEIPGVLVFNTEIQVHPLTPAETSIYVEMTKQVAMFADQMKNNTALADGFNLIGFSQGTLISRGYIEMYNDPPVKTFISISGPLAGQYGIPFVDIKWIDEILSQFDYNSETLQKLFAPLQYWRNPKLNDMYLKHSLYLAKINNERPNEFNQTYYDNFSSLDRLVLSHSTDDGVIHPSISGWFGFYNENMTKMNMTDTAWFKEDLFGLKKLYDEDKISLYTTKWHHSENKDKIAVEFLKNDIIPWLRN